jgi:GMP synthase (glutamine-hydrolysing)
MAVNVLAIVYQRDAGPGVFAEAIEAAGDRLEQWLPARDPLPPRELGEYDAVISLGGAMHAHQEREHPWLAEQKQMLGRLLDAGTPLLGVCLGAQLVAEAAGAEVRRAPVPEIGWYPVEAESEAAGDRLLGPLAPSFMAFEWHSYEFSLPPGATPLGRTEACLQGFRLGAAAWAIQFHAEVARSDLESWIDDYASDPDAVAAGIDPEALAAVTRAELPGFNRLGRDLCRRFLDVARERA